MTATAVTPPAARLRAPSWRDPRLVVGVLLVLASVLLGAWAVSARDATRPVWAASSVLVPGDDVAPGALRVVRVHLGAGAAGYLPADRPLPGGLVVLRTVGSGELLPRAAVGSAARLRRRPLGLAVSGSLASGVVKGAAVDVWVSVPAARTAGSTGAGSGGYAPPRLLARAARVAEVSGARTGLGSDGSRTVQVLLGPTALRAALAAQADGARTALVLVPGSTPAGS